MENLFYDHLLFVRVGGNGVLERFNNPDLNSLNPMGLESELALTFLSAFPNSGLKKPMPLDASQSRGNVLEIIPSLSVE
jgi:hypothetical protein